MNWKEYRFKVLTVIIVYLIVCIPVLGGLMTSMELSTGEGSKLINGAICF